MASLETNGETADTRSQSTSEFVLILKEKEAVKATLAEKEKELTTAQVRNYDLMQQIDKLEKNLAKLKEERKAEKEKLKSAQQANEGSQHGGSPHMKKKHRPKTAKHPHARKTPRKGAGKKANVKDATNESELAKPNKDTYSYYKEIAEKYPMLRLSVLLAAEERFIEADINNDGTIDAYELDKILENSRMLFTKQQVRDIVKEIDSDGSNSLDFIECLAVIDRLHQNKKTALPTSLEQNKSTVCSIQ
ncbi:uncharacterized protein LOC117105792 [Anneissia japonica]|uniref:uncharacterized protein LOC117105792 n=1 Tax=Anneissia japonica TaxID=1529436 RepID=UPI0014259D88|nr:uncharacterized protein LOC117105792 [Anneissia japonica]